MKKNIYTFIISILVISFLIQNCMCQWVQTNGPAGSNVISFALDNSKIFAGTYYGGVFSGTFTSQSLIQTSLSNQHISGIAISGTKIFAGTFNGVFLSTNEGQSWTQTSLNNQMVISITVAGSYVYAATTQSYIYYSTDNGQSWVQTSFYCPYSIYQLASMGSVIFVSTDSYGIYYSTNNGLNWVQTLNPKTVYSLCVSGSNIYAGTDTYGVYLSTDNGNTWIQKSTNQDVYYLASDGPNVFASSVIGINNYVLKSTNYGDTWTQVLNPPGNITRALAIKNSDVYSSNALTGIYHSSNLGQNWTEISMKDVQISAIILSGSNIISGNYLSSNNGQSWISTSILGHVYSLIENGSNLLAGTNDGITISTDHGFTWLTPTLGDEVIISFAKNNTYIFAGTAAHGGFRSSDNGQTWEQILVDLYVYAIAANGSNIFAGTSSGVLNYKVFFSSNNGQTWTESSLSNVFITTFILYGSNIFAGGDGLFFSTNNGQSWSNLNFNHTVYTLSNNNSIIFAGCNDGVYMSTNNCVSWIQKNEGLGSQQISSMFIASNYVYLGTTGSSVWYRPLSELIGIRPISNEIPSHFSLSQNYPNPFNPSTNIKYQIAKNSYVKLTVYDILGREVATLVNEQLPPGTYEVEFNGSNYPSGVYFYKLSAGDFNETKKFILLK